MKTYVNEQLEANLTEVSDIAKKVAKNVNGIRITVSPIGLDTMTVNGLTHILDVGEEFSFFYTSLDSALADQATLTTHLRLRGVAVSKVHKQQPFTLNQ